MAGKYLTPEVSKRDVSINEDDESEVEWLKDSIAESNRQVENDTRAVYSSFPTDPTTDLFTSFRDAALSWFKYKWALKNRDKEGYESFKLEYNAKINGLKNVSKREESGAHRFSEYF